jgi:hypothetical protein
MDRLPPQTPSKDFSKMLKDVSKSGVKILHKGQGFLWAVTPAHTHTKVVLFEKD